MQFDFFPSRTLTLYLAKLFVVRILAVLVMLVLVLLMLDLLTATGKILAVDRILSVARYAGEERFRDQQPWAEQFARYTAALLGRDLIRVDVENYSIGY